MKPTLVFISLIFLALLWEASCRGRSRNRRGGGWRSRRGGWGRGRGGGWRFWRGGWGRRLPISPGDLYTKLCDLEEAYDSVVGNLTALQEQLAALEAVDTSCCIPEGCDTRWYKIYEHSANGTASSGSKDDLITALTSGAAVRVWHTDERYFTYLQNTVIIEGNVCGQALHHISIYPANLTFQDPAYWWWTLQCTSGHRQEVRYNVGEFVSRDVSRETHPMAWFVRDSSVSEPIISVASSGTINAGSVERAVEAVNNAEDVRLLINGGFAYPASNMQYSQAMDLVAAMGIWEVSQANRVRDGVKVKEFRGTDDYWYFTSRATTAAAHVSRWNVGVHVRRSQSSGSASMDWFSDYCWKQVFKHYANGDTISGSLSNLIEAIEDGHRVKIVYQGKSLEADDIRIRNGHVSASLLNDLSKSAINTFESSVDWVWTLAHTTGSLKTIRYEVGANNLVGVSDESETIAWFTDQRPWREVLEVDKSGMVLSGSKDELLDAIRNGAEVRYRILSDDVDGVFQTADNLKMSPDEADVAAMHVRSISVEFDGENEVKFLSDPFWCFTMVTTYGVQDKSGWSVGVHTNRGHDSSQVRVQWFINE